ncbi:MAG TPA: P63C domain-containing protein [Roseiflexaceae bacterium]|nr:P63C domain-containing protein [Roseiflexaceae bacterium]
MIAALHCCSGATGYREQRQRDELRKILEAYISEELRPWVRVFPEEFFKQLYRIHGWEYKHTNARTPYVGKLINRYIYEQLPEGVLQGLQAKNPVTKKGYRKHKHHQYLTIDTGDKHLDRQIASVTTLMRAADNKDDFERMFQKVFPKATQSRLPLVIDAETPSSMFVQGELPLFE